MTVSRVPWHLSNEAVVMVPSGLLRAGLKRKHVRDGIACGAQAIALDSGSTDGGPAYLARGISTMHHKSVKSGLLDLMSEARRGQIPLLIGSRGTAETSDEGEWTVEIAMEVAAELQVTTKIAAHYSDQSGALIKAKAATRVHPVPAAKPLDGEAFDQCDHIVALMDPEPYVSALMHGANSDLGGSTVEVAGPASVPLVRGAGIGSVWHASKVAECGGLCTVNPQAGDVLIQVGHELFEIGRLGANYRYSTEGVSLHMLCETTDPICLIELGGVLDVMETSHDALDTPMTRVTGPSWKTMPYTSKLDGANRGSYMRIILIGIEDPTVLVHRDSFDDNRSKKANPFWIEIDLFANGRENYSRYSDSLALSADKIGVLDDVPVSSVKRVAVDRLYV